MCLYDTLTLLQLHISTHCFDHVGSMQHMICTFVYDSVFIIQLREYNWSQTKLTEGKDWEKKGHSSKKVCYCSTKDSDMCSCCWRQDYCMLQNCRHCGHFADTSDGVPISHPSTNKRGGENCLAHHVVWLHRWSHQITDRRVSGVHVSLYSIPSAS